MLLCYNITFVIMLISYSSIKFIIAVRGGRHKDKAMQDDLTALILASRNGHLEVARLLCDAGADKDKAMQDGVTALISASARGHLDVVQLLCEAGGGKDKANENGATA